MLLTSVYSELEPVTFTTALRIENGMELSLWRCQAALLSP